MVLENGGMLLGSKVVRGVLVGALLFSCALVSAQDWQVVRINPQKSFPKMVAAGNYSGITRLGENDYAVVSDKSDSALYFNFHIQVNPSTGELVRVENLGFSEYVDGRRAVSGKELANSRSWEGRERGFDNEAIAKVSDSTLVIASEGFFRLKEYPILPDSGQISNLWEMKWRADEFYPNYDFESLAFDSVRHCLWTISESTLRRDGEPASTENGLANRLRLMRIDWQERYKVAAGDSGVYQIKAYAYEMDKPTTQRKAETYVMGVSELCVLPDGQLLVLEREAFIPKIKVGAFCKCKLYVVNPWQERKFPMSEPFSGRSPFVKKRLLAEWKTGLSIFDRSFANYEGMCLGPQLEDGSWVLVLLSDSQDQYAGVLRDWFKTIVIKKG